MVLDSSEKVKTWGQKVQKMDKNVLLKLSRFIEFSIVFSF